MRHAASSTRFNLSFFGLLPMYVIYPGLNAYEIQSVRDKHRKVSSLVKSRHNAYNSEVIWKCQIILPNFEVLIKEYLCSILGHRCYIVTVAICFWRHSSKVQFAWYFIFQANKALTSLIYIGQIKCLLHCAPFNMMLGLFLKIHHRYNFFFLLHRDYNMQYTSLLK